MIKLNAILFAFLAIFSSLIAASGAADAKHCAPRPCCGCPGNGKSKVKALMDIFLNRLQENQRSDAFQLVSTVDALMRFYNNTQCDVQALDISAYFDFFFPVGSLFINADKEFIERHDGSIDAQFLAVVTQPNEVTKAYSMVYKWAVDVQCNWHISGINGVDSACLLPPPTQ